MNTEIRKESAYAKLYREAAEPFEKKIKVCSYISLVFMVGVIVSMIGIFFIKSLVLYFIIFIVLSGVGATICILKNEKWRKRVCNDVMVYRDIDGCIEDLHLQDDEIDRMDIILTEMEQGRYDIEIDNVRLNFTGDFVYSLRYDQRPLSFSMCRMSRVIRIVEQECMGEYNYIFSESDNESEWLSFGVSLSKEHSLVVRDKMRNILQDKYPHISVVTRSEDKNCD